MQVEHPHPPSYTKVVSADTWQPGLDLSVAAGAVRKDSCLMSCLFTWDCPDLHLKVPSLLV